jgi:hypothetical protein
MKFSLSLSDFIYLRPGFAGIAFLRITAFYDLYGTPK